MKMKRFCMKKLFFITLSLFTFCVSLNAQRTLLVKNSQHTKTRVLNINNPSANKSVSWTDIFNNTQSGGTKEILLTQNDLNPDETLSLPSVPTRAFYLHFVYTFINPTGQQVQQRYKEQVFLVPAGNDGDAVCVSVSNFNAQLCSQQEL